MNYTNTSNIALPLAVFLATDGYDHENNTISATSIMKSTRQYILGSRVNQSEAFIDIASLIASRLGTSIHNGIEESWKGKNLAKTLQALGQPKRVYENIIVNPTQELVHADPSVIPVYMEIRSYMDILGYRISGKFDFVGGGKVQDYKTTSSWSYIYQTNRESFIIQMSIYKLLNPDIITKPTGTIHYVFMDWSKTTAERTKDYPASRLLSQDYPLMSEKETMAYLKGKLNAITMYDATPEPELPPCNDAELWRKEDTWKYYANPLKMGKSTKNFKSMSEAHTRFAKDGATGIVKFFPGKVVACNYCPAFALCTQKDAYIASGELIL